MKKHLLALGLVGILGLFVMWGCGGNSTMSTANTPTGSLALFGTDAPLCDVVSFQVTITGATLTPQGGGAAVSVLPSGQTITVDFARLMEFTSLLNLTQVPEGTYTQLTLTFSNPQLSVLNVSTTPPSAQSVTTTLTTNTATATLNPALVVAKNSPAGLKIDFNLRKSVQVDANGQVTGTVDPVIRAFVSMRDRDKIADDVHGLISNVSTTSSNPAYTGSFTIQTQGGFGPAVTIFVSSNTQFEEEDSGMQGLSSLATGEFVEVEAAVDSNGNMVAKEIEVEEGSTTQISPAAFLGKVVGVTRDSSGNATQFTLLVAEEFPDLHTTVPLESDLTVNVASTSVFAIRNWGMNEDSLSFGPTTLGLDQKVVVRSNTPSGSPASVTADRVVLRAQTVLGNFTTLLASQSDGETGGFTMKPCSAIYGGQSITVLTFGDDEFDGLTSLSGLTPTPTVAAKGLLFFEQTSASVNSISWTAPTWVLEAHRIHVLP